MKTVKSDFITVPQAAKMIGCYRTHLSRMCKAGKIPSVRIGRFYYLSRSDIAAFQRERERRRRSSAQAS